VLVVAVVPVVPVVPVVVVEAVVVVVVDRGGTPRQTQPVATSASPVRAAIATRP
jgi:hypothetical protein